MTCSSYLVKLRLLFEELLDWEIRFQSTRYMISIGRTPYEKSVCEMYINWVVWKYEDVGSIPWWCFIILDVAYGIIVMIEDGINVVIGFLWIIWNTKVKEKSSKLCWDFEQECIFEYNLYVTLRLNIILMSSLKWRTQYF